MKIDHNEPDGDFYENEHEREKLSNVSCECGNTELFVNFLQAPFCGCYVKVTCSKCENSAIVFDDFS
jgi:hypothetical protein